ncbi:hypothetical protein [Merismopedia glauca]|uniref:Glycosyl transferase n=1 Tax=Merismopedia glauca CCAP 1448/3 TaxID=1296344 RepID=A0A2T1C766_9CYAN|nr:hypothetical protein [Merismopedia glauca]PSB04125.1 hypothetical protein C7B64_05135 [Merismopedia glauca CCAP 1448/3]
MKSWRQFWWRKPTVLAFIDLIQDLDVLLPLLIASKTREDLCFKVCVTDWVIEHSPRVKNILESLKIDYFIVVRRAVKMGLQPSLKGIKAMITAAETTAGPHVCAHNLTKRCDREGILTYTLQHGFENIGLTYFDEIHSAESIHFAAQKILIWGDLNTLSPQVLPETKSRCIPVGCFKEISLVTSGVKIPGQRDDEAIWQNLAVKRDYLVAIFENLHWHRYSDEYRSRFLADLEKTANLFPDITFLIKPHHAGQWLTDRYQGQIPNPENLIIADPKNPRWEGFTAPAIIHVADGAITTPSTVALDAAQSNCPVAAIAYGLELPNYEPLSIINSLEDWIAFINSLQTPETRLILQKQASDFICQNIVPGDAVERVLRIISTDIHTKP